MIIEAVDDRQDLYQVRNIIPKNLMDELDNQVLEALPYTKQPWQETFERRSLSIMPGSVFERINSFLYDQKQHIGDCINKKIQKLSSAFWFDTEGFSMTEHIDNPGVVIAMQIYLNECPGAGTVFYDISDEDVQEEDNEQCYVYNGPMPPKKMRKTFEFTKNNGYIMINNKKQLHGFPKTLLENEKRLSAYCWIA